jgi:hypothetical protein
MTLSGFLIMAELAIDCAQVDLNAMRDGDWLTLKDRLYDFFTQEIEWSLSPRRRPLTNDQIIGLGSLIRSARPIDDDDYVVNADCIEPIMALAGEDSARWQETLKRLHGTYIQEGFRQFLTTAATEEFSDFIEFNLKELTVWDDSVIDFAPLAAARLQLYLVAGGVEKNQIRTCPECKKIFLNRRKPRADKKYHCSNRCAQQYASKEYRKRTKEELRSKERERSHRRYVSKRRKRFPNAPIGRRPRKQMPT